MIWIFCLKMEEKEREYPGGIFVSVVLHILQFLEVSKAVCASLVKEKKTAAPPKLFDLTSLQREANRLFGYTAKQTLDLAQSLYEKRLLTYPRTDSAFLTDDMSDTAAGIIKLLCGKFSFMAGKDFTPELPFAERDIRKCIENEIDILKKRGAMF